MNETLSGRRFERNLGISGHRATIENRLFVTPTRQHSAWLDATLQTRNDYAQRATKGLRRPLRRCLGTKRGNDTMADTNDVDRNDDDILMRNVPDEALEAAAYAGQGNGGAYTVAFCTG